MNTLLVKKIIGQLRESLSAVLPIFLIVMALSFTAAPVPGSLLLCFLMGAFLVIVGMMFFTMGAEMSMKPIGEKAGSFLTRSKKVRVIAPAALALGFIVTVAEPDLQVLAGQVPSIPSKSLIFAVAGGVGIFLMLALLRMLFKVSLNLLLLGAYAVIFALAAFVPSDLLAVAFDSGGVTTGPMTVPFIMALGVGVAAIRNDKSAVDDSFGLVALCSVGPILAVMVLSLAFGTSGGTYLGPSVPDIENSVELGRFFAAGFWEYMKEVAVSLLPIALFFAFFQLFFLKLSRKGLLKIIVGLAYTYVGLVFFLTGANVGFMPAAYYLGGFLASGATPYVIIPVAMLAGFFVVRAEPAVYVLNRQVEEMTNGGISASTMGLSLSVGVAVSLGLAMVRVLTGISVLWFLIPGYAIALGISFFVPKIYTAIAFDSGGVASGPMTAAFLLPLAQGACMALGGDIVRDAFGVVAMVAMTPLITIQVLGLVSGLRRPEPAPAPAESFSAFEIIEL